MVSHKKSRTEEDMKRVIAEVINNEIKDPDVEGIVSITKIEITQDLKFAKIYTSIYSKNRNKTLEGIKRAAPYIRKQVSQRVKMRITPQLTFLIDESLDYGAHINSVLKTLNIKPEEKVETKD